MDKTPTVRAVVVDATDPDTRKVSGPIDRTSDRTPTFRFTSEKGATFRCRLDGGTWVRCTSAWTTRTLARHVRHTFEVRATDPAGNVEDVPAAWRLVT